MRKWPGLHPDPTKIGPIATQTKGDERGHQTAYYTYRLCRDKMRTLIHNWSQKCCIVKNKLWVEIRCNGPVPVKNRIRNRTVTLDPLLTLDEDRGGVMDVSPNGQGA
jgi:hypothetical protein